MSRVDKLSFSIGMLVASLLTWSAYYSNSHPGATKISEFVYLILFPPSVGFMAAENASKMEQVIIVALVVTANGGFYWLISFMFRKLIALAERP